MKKIKQSKGITLVALVITVIILLILAGVAINALNNTDMIAKSEKATEEYKKKAATEIINLKITNIQISNYVEKQKMPTLQELADGLCDDNEMEYVLTTSKNVASLGKLDRINVGTASSIFTKLKAYPYEFEINSLQQIAAIDGEKIIKDNPFKPEIKLSNEGWAKSIIIEVDWKQIPYTLKKEISIDGGKTYKEYTGKMQIDKNCIIIAKASSETQNYISDEKRVSKIDKLGPNEFKPIVLEGESGVELKINANTSDKEANEESAQSGIKGYKYFVYEGSNLVKNSEIIGESWEVQGLTVGTTYNIYVEAYDNAGNMIKSEEVEYKKLNVYTWSKYSIDTTSGYAYHVTQTNLEERIGISGMGVTRVAVSSLDGQFNTSNGLWTCDIGGIQGDMLGHYMHPDAFSSSKYGFSDPTNILWHVKSVRAIYSNRYITYDVYESYLTDIYKQGTISYGTVTSNDENAYPTCGEKLDESDGVIYWYVKQ